MGCSSGQDALSASDGCGLVPTIFVADPFLRLKEKKLVPTTNLKEEQRERALSKAAEAEEEGGTLLFKKERVDAL